LLDAVNSGVNDRGLVIRWIAPERAAELSGLVPTETFDFPITSGSSNFLVKSGTNPIDPDSYNSGLKDFLIPNSTVTDSGFNDITTGTWEVEKSTSATGVAIQSGVVNEFDDSGLVESSGFRNIKYTVRIPFRMSKVAPSSGIWNVGVMIHDRIQQEINTTKTGDLYDYYAWAPGGYGNQWYGEVNVVANDSIEFGDVEAGGEFKVALQSGLNSGVRVLFVSNGLYNQDIRSDTTWTPDFTVPSRPDFAYLTFTSGLTTPSSADSGLLISQGNRFAIQARRFAIDGAADSFDFLDVNPAGPPGDSNFVFDTDNGVYRELGDPSAKPSAYTTVSTANPTSEIGIESVFEFQIRISSVFQNAIYSGNLTIGVSNALNGS